MTLHDLITYFRAQAQDEEEPFFCSNVLLTVYANEAQTEAARRGMLIRRSATIPYHAGDRTVDIDPLVIYVLRAQADGHCVTALNFRHMDEAHPGWQSDTVRGTPQVLIEGMDDNKLHIWPIPDKDGQFEIVLQMMPEPMRLPSDAPEIRAEAHPALVHWMLYRAYSREDIEIYNPQKAQAALSEFVSEFGMRNSLRNEQWVRDGMSAIPHPTA